MIAIDNNLYFWDENNQFLDIYIKELNIDSDIVSLLDETSRTWIGTVDEGLFILDKTTKTLYSAQEANPWSIHVPAESINQITIIDGKYWLATENGLFEVQANGTVKELYSEKSSTSNAPFVFFAFSYQEQLWIGTDVSLDIYDFNTKHFLSIGPDSVSLTGLSQRYLLTYLKDTNDNIWIGSYQGLFKYNSKESHTRVYSNQKSFQEKKDGNSIWAIKQDKEETLWFVTQNEGMGRFSFDTGKISYYITERNETFWDLVIDNNGYFWIATSDGIKVFRRDKSKFTFVTSFFEGNFIDSIYEANNKIWLVMEENKAFSIDSALLPGYLDSPDATPITETHYITGIDRYSAVQYADTLGRLWIASKESLFIYNPTSKKIIKSITLNKDSDFRTVTIFSWRDSYWLLNSLNTLSKIDKTRLEIIDSKVVDAEGKGPMSAISHEEILWIATNDSIYAYDLSTSEKIETFSLEQLGYNSFNDGVVLKTANDHVVFAGSSGFNRIKLNRPEFRLAADYPTQKPLILATKVFGYNIDGESGLTQNIISAEHGAIELKYDESRFSITFELINPLFPNLVEYRYRLQGADGNWMNSEGGRNAQFNNIPFGSYTFEVQAKEPGKDWSKTSSLKIKIGRPPWLHTGALAFYALIFASILLLLFKNYQSRKKTQLAVRESEERLKLTLWSSGDELWDWDVYKGQVYRSNTWGTLDFPQDNIRTSTAYDANIHPNDLLRVQEALKAHLANKTEYYELTYRAKTFNNQWIWILDRGKVVTRDHNDQPIRMTGTLKNIHHLKEAEEQLNLFKRSIENISEGVFITNTNFKFISVNNAYCQYTGETRDQALASYLYFHQYPEPYTEEIKKTLRAKGNWFGEVESARINGEKFEMEMNIDAVHNEEGRISHFVGVFSDITSRKNTEKELLKLANTDPLTDLPNRSFFQASHQNLVRRTESHALLCLDMDNFKKINDSLGHQTGDVLIKQIAKRIQRTTGKTATCYRLGGDEFSVLLEDKSDIHTITHYAQGLLDTLSRPFIINKQEFVLGASIGIAFYPEDGVSSQEMLKNADTAMYFAKNNGGNSYKFFSGEMNQNAVRQLQIENLIRQGIKDDLFSVFYQPKIDINSGRLVSMEALVRFEHPHKGIVSPGQFIPLAEQTGQIIEIGEQVLRKALSDTKRWVSEGIFSGRVAVNISAKQFELPDLDDRIIRILQEVGLSPLHLECEITEGTLMENPEEGLRMMERLREKGIHLALDDFGTGYSSLAYLKRFPLNTLKIDKAFIDDIDKSSVDRHMTAAIINIAHNLGLKVVAEGVEKESQLTILRRYECEMLQGFLYSRPINAERFEALLRENQQLHNLISNNNHS
ncbi:EAL domain-containing protein [Salinimonas marina]|uniref:EAL domain-containing protein n=1 Tax=Salinimonas marina TaxID=2785918 RepID=UPI001E2CC936|nr:EAL domain-containing protein [Salinimonas marina]